jgi:hypothetical protein
MAWQVSVEIQVPVRSCKADRKTEDGDDEVVVEMRNTGEPRSISWRRRPSAFFRHVAPLANQRSNA